MTVWFTAVWCAENFHDPRKEIIPTIRKERREKKREREKGVYSMRRKLDHGAMVNFNASQVYRV